MARILLVICILFSGYSQAGVLNYIKDSEKALVYGWKSHHFITENHSNDTHHLVAFRFNNFIAGTFDNSYGRETYFLGAHGDTQLISTDGQSLNFKVFGVIGAMRGYTKCYGDDGSNANVCPMAAIGISYTGIKHIHPTIFQLGDASTIGVIFEF